MKLGKNNLLINMLPINLMSILNFLMYLSIGLGIYFRFKGLGTWPLAVDEYYFIKSVENILKYGLPQFEYGGYYPRGIIQQYLTAGNLLLGFSAELGGRIIPVIFNLLAIPAIYKLGKIISGELLATTAVIVFSLSIWEVEIARFLRMYAPFQTIFIWYIYFLYKAVFENDHKSEKWIWVLSFVGIFIYEASIFLVLLNFVYIFWDKNEATVNIFSFKFFKKNSAKLIIGFVILIIAYVFLTTNFRTLEQENLYPPELVDYFKNQTSVGGVFRKPILLLAPLFSNKIWLILYSILFLSNVFLLNKIGKNETSIFIRTAAFSLILLSVLNLLGLLIVFFLIFMLIGWLKPNDLFKNFTAFNGFTKTKLLPTKLLWLLLASLSLNLFFWIIYTLLNKEWYNYFHTVSINGALTALKVIFKYYLNYPNFYEAFILFKETIPLITYVIIFLFVWLLIFTIINFNKTNTQTVRFFLFIGISLLLLIVILDLKYFDTRYFFFGYPLVILLSMLSLIKISEILTSITNLQKIFFFSLLIIILFISEDFDLKYLMKIDSYNINFRVDKNLALKKHFYQRWDVKSPAVFINKNERPEDIVISNEQVNEYYLNKIDYIYIDYRSRMREISILGGTKERWTGSNLIYTMNTLLKIIENRKSNIWLIVNTLWGTRFFEEVNFFDNYKVYMKYANPDNSVLVYYFPSTINYKK